MTNSYLRTLYPSILLLNTSQIIVGDGMQNKALSNTICLPSQMCQQRVAVMYEIVLLYTSPTLPQPHMCEVIPLICSTFEGKKILFCRKEIALTRKFMASKSNSRKAHILQERATSPAVKDIYQVSV